MFPSIVDNLIESFKKLPGIGQKSAERFVFSIISDFDDDDYDVFISSLSDIKSDLKYCKKCNFISDNDICSICLDSSRNSDVLIVVKSFKDVYLLEKMGIFNGFYYVLGDFISPFDGVMPEDLDIDLLLKRIKDDNVKEIIFFFKSGIEADTTILYIKKLLEGFSVKISRVANGIPVGADVDYMDSLTLESAFNNRKEVLD